eukprot:scaffold11360_cov114-Isochrysis_galbana.AAC.7
MSICKRPSSSIHRSIVHRAAASIRFAPDNWAGLQDPAEQGGLWSPGALAHLFPLAVRRTPWDGARRGCQVGPVWRRSHPSGGGQLPVSPCTVGDQGPQPPGPRALCYHYYYGLPPRRPAHLCLCPIHQSILPLFLVSARKIVCPSGVVVGVNAGLFKSYKFFFIAGCWRRSALLRAAVSLTHRQVRPGPRRSRALRQERVADVASLVVTRVMVTCHRLRCMEIYGSREGTTRCLLPSPSRSAAQPRASSGHLSRPSGLHPAAAPLQPAPASPRPPPAGSPGPPDSGG